MYYRAFECLVPELLRDNVSVVRIKTVLQCLVVRQCQVYNAVVIRTHEQVQLQR